MTNKQWEQDVQEKLVATFSTLQEVDDILTRQARKGDPDAEYWRSRINVAQEQAQIVESEIIYNIRK